MSSKNWPESKKLDGIFNLDEKNNPMHDANMVYLPYCSSDAFLADLGGDEDPAHTLWGF